MEVIKLISRTMGSLFGSYFNSDLDVMSEDAKRILSNEEDRKKYVDAIEKLKGSPNKEITITLSTNETITLVS